MSMPGKTGLVHKEPLLQEISSSQKEGVDLPPLEIDELDPAEHLPGDWLREEIEDFPELTEPEIARHFTRLSSWNYSLDAGFYPLGSCTMKYNPRLNETAAAFEGFAQAHPYLDDKDAQGLLSILYELQEDLKEISGLNHVCLQPSAGSHGELLGIMLIASYHRARGDKHRTKILIPDSAHGTNPSSAATCDLEAVTLASGPDGQVDLEVLKAHLDENTAGLMITNPNCCGLFESRIEEIAAMVHDAGGLLYFDGANMNALVGKARPGDMGVDVLHFNTHKTFSTPHGGGGPGAGPIALTDELAPFLPKPVLEKNEEGFFWDYDRPQSIGRIRAFYGNIGILIRAYCYIKTMGNTGLKQMTETAVLNANYLKKKLEEHFEVPFQDQSCMHEVLLTDGKLTGQGITTMDLAKALIDRGFHPPTVYFPLIVSGAMLVEPTETESKKTLDDFVEAMVELSKSSPENFEKIPKNSFVNRLDEVTAARKPVLRWEKL